MGGEVVDACEHTRVGVVLCPGSGGATRVVGVRPFSVPELTLVTKSGAACKSRTDSLDELGTRPTLATRPKSRPHRILPFASEANSHTMSPPTWEDTPHLGAGSRYGPTPAADGGKRPAAAGCNTTGSGVPMATRSRPCDRPQSHPPISPGNRVDLVDFSTTTALRALPEVLTAREAAAILRIGRNRLYQAVAHGQLGAIRIGRSIRIPKQTLLALLASTCPLTASSDEQPRQPATQVRQGPP